MNTKRGNQVVVTNMDNKLSEEQKAFSSVISDPTTKLSVEAASCLICQWLDDRRKHAFDQEKKKKKLFFPVIFLVAFLVESMFSFFSFSYFLLYMTGETILHDL